jgi:signal transduction histidine kinase
MNRWLQRLCVFGLIAALVAGGLGWATAESLRMERDQRESTAREKRTEQVRLALWAMDSHVAPLLAREDGRPYAHFTPLHAPIPALSDRGELFEPGQVRVPSPLLEVELPDWMLLHFQVHPKMSWQSPQVLSQRLATRIQWPPSELTLANVTQDRAALLAELKKKYPYEALLAEVKRRGLRTLIADPQPDVKSDNPADNNTAGNQPNAAPANPQQPWAQNEGLWHQQRLAPDTEQQKRNDAYQRSRGFNNRDGKDGGNFVDLDAATTMKHVACEIHRVRLSLFTPVWMPSADHPEHLFFLRLANVDSTEIIQGIALDWPTIEQELRASVADLFPDARLVPLPDGTPANAERVMSSLPVQLDPGPAKRDPAPRFTPLRIGLSVAWAATLFGLVAVGVSGLSLIDLSERRVRFVSAVTHELRTPLTTLRLYLDMLTSGLVREEAQREEYLQTLSAESERLHRLIGNVLDFARLEKQSAKAVAAPVAVADLIERLKAAWHDRCGTAEKELVVENRLPADATVRSDADLVQQIVGNLIDNACKYSKCAADRRVWLRAVPAGPGRVAFEVEDCGPGVNPRERRSIFRPFRRGRTADVTAGGVGLGLALARRWAKMLGGRLDIGRGARGSGACFRVELPV